jgi:type II secretory pathway pseudopilin PulG
MKLHQRLICAFTLTELLVGVSLLAMTTPMLYIVLNWGMISYAKNAAINAAHQEARYAAARLMRDIHGSASVPQLVDVNLNSVTSQPLNGSGQPTGTAGITFQMVGCGPIQMKNDPGNKNMIQFYSDPSNPLTITPGMRLIMKDYGVEDDIIKVTSNGANHYNLWTKNGQEARIKEKKGTYLVAYITRRSAYVVAPTANPKLYELRFYADTTITASYVVISRSITSPTPFSVPLNNGAPDYRYIAVKLTTGDSRISNRSYKATDTLIDTAIPYRSQLCKYP